MPRVRESIHNSLRKLGDSSQVLIARYPGQSDCGSVGPGAGCVLEGRQADLAWPVCVGRGSGEEVEMGPSWFGLSSGFCVAFQAPLNLNSYYYDYYYYCFIIIFIISHLDLCFTNDRILKHQIPKHSIQGRRRRPGPASGLCLRCCSGGSWSLHSASSWPSSI